MPQLADNIQNLLKNQINVQTLRNRTNRVGIEQQRANTGSQNANTNRVNSLVKAGDYEAAEKVYENEPGNRDKGLTFKFLPEQNILTVKGRNKSESFSYDPRDISGTLKHLPQASLQGGTEPDITNDIAELTLQKQGLIRGGATEDSQTVRDIDEVIDAINKGSGRANDVWDTIKKQHPGDFQGAIDAFIENEAALVGAKSKQRVIDREGGEQEILAPKQDRLADEATARVQGRTRPVLSKQKTETRRVVDEINLIMKAINKNPAIVGLPGALSKTITSFADQAANLADLIIPGKQFAVLNNVRRYGELFRETGIDKAKLEAKFLGVSLGVASAEGFVNRAVTELKVRANLKRLGAALGSPQQMFEVLKQFKQELVAGYQSSIDAFNQLEALEYLFVVDLAVVLIG